jgi:hypothetical protein
MDFSHKYDELKQAQEKYNKEKFNYFMNGLATGLASDLDKAFKTDLSHYELVLDRVKQLGFRVLRNSKGEHKLI